MSWCSVVWAAPCLILAILSFSATVAQELGPAPAPSPGLVEAANDTLYFVDATCFGLGRFSGEGTAETGPAGTFRSDDGLNFNGSGLVNSTRGIWTGQCVDIRAVFSPPHSLSSIGSCAQSVQPVFGSTSCCLLACHGKYGKRPS